MKIVINACFGGWSINPEIADKYGFDMYDEDITNEKLIELIESGVNCSDECSNLKVVEIPDNATDWRVIEYDGAEYIIYVVDGKMHSID